MVKFVCFAAIIIFPAFCLAQESNANGPFRSCTSDSRSNVCKVKRCCISEVSPEVSGGCCTQGFCIIENRSISWCQSSQCRSSGQWCQWGTWEIMRTNPCFRVRHRDCCEKCSNRRVHPTNCYGLKEKGSLSQQKMELRYCSRPRNYTTYGRLVAILCTLLILLLAVFAIFFIRLKARRRTRVQRSPRCTISTIETTQTVPVLPPTYEEASVIFAQPPPSYEETVIGANSGPRGPT